jgi:hypothetical protein
MTQVQDTVNDGQARQDRRDRLRYLLLTAGLFLPLLLSFAGLRNLYPFAASTMMLGDRDMQSDRTYYVLRGETVGGEIIDLRPITLTNALTGRNWSMVSAAVENKSFKIRSPHPANIQLALAFGGVDKLPAATRLPDLLRSWGEIYNSRLPASSNQKLRAVRLDAYRWEGGINGDYDRFVESWTAQL